uniref:Eukaryotic translation initiation factor 3 subunit M n=1 Tax=Bos indicus x Bos taurus TaxID=30522 RepID=A0A4W2CGX8_BOBOX
VGGREGRGERIGGRVARAPECGRCLELLTPAAWLPPASQSSNKRGRRRGRRRSQESRRLHSHRSPSGSRQGARLLGGVLAVRVGGGPEGASLSETPSSPTRHALFAGLWDTGLPPHLPFSAFASVGASGHWRAAPGHNEYGFPLWRSQLMKNRGWQSSRWCIFGKLLTLMQKAAELRAYLKSKGAEISEENSEGGLHVDLAQIIEACDVCLKEDDKDVESVMNSVVSLLLILEPDKQEALIESLCEKLVKFREGERPSLRLQLLENGFLTGTSPLKKNTPF